MNIDHGDSSRSIAAAGFSAVTLSAGDVFVLEATGAAIAAGEGAAGWAVAAGGCAGATGCCWADASEANATMIDAVSNLKTILNMAPSILRTGLAQN
jgi:hypothetical protein